MTEQVLIPFALLGLLVAAGKRLCVRVKLFHRLYLPSAMIGGLIGLAARSLRRDVLPASWTAGGHTLPGILINVVFVSLFLRTDLPPIREAWRRAGPQLAYGQIVA